MAAIEAFTAGKAFDDYLADHMRRHAVERCLKIVSEASRHIPRQAKTRHAAIRFRSSPATGRGRLARPATIVDVAAVLVYSAGDDRSRLGDHLRPRADGDGAARDHRGAGT
jgi:uncharacterized protein with HEPN domain